MSRLAELISRTLKELKVKKKVDEIYWERETDDDGWDVVTYYGGSHDNNRQYQKERERIDKLNSFNQKLKREKDQDKEEKLGKV